MPFTSTRQLRRSKATGGGGSGLTRALETSDQVLNHLTCAGFPKAAIFESDDQPVDNGHGSDELLVSPKKFPLASPSPLGAKLNANTYIFHFPSLGTYRKKKK